MTSQASESAAIVARLERVERQGGRAATLAGVATTLERALDQLRALRRSKP